MVGKQMKQQFPARRFRGWHTIFFLLLFCGLTLSPVSAEYNIKVGDAFKFEIELMDAPYIYLQVGSLVFSEGTVMKVRITYVNIPYIKYSITINSQTEEFTILSNILVQDRNWANLTAKYQAEGYEIYEDSKIWGVRLNGSTYLKVDYLKRDGVLNYFHARNESTLKSALKIDEIVLNRIWDNYKIIWPYAFFALLPLGGLVYGLVRYSQKINSLEREREA